MFENFSLLNWAVLGLVGILLDIYLNNGKFTNGFIGGMFRTPTTVTMPLARIRGRQGVKFEQTGWENEGKNMPSGILMAGDFSKSVRWSQVHFPPHALAPMNIEPFDLSIEEEQQESLLRENARLKDRFAVAERELEYAWEYKFDTLQAFLTQIETARKKIGSTVVVSDKAKGADVARAAVVEEGG